LHFLFPTFQKVQGTLTSCASRGTQVLLQVSADIENKSPNRKQQPPQLNRRHMKSETVDRAFKVMMMIGGLLAVVCPTGWAAKVPAVLTFSDTWVDKVGCTGSNSQGDLDCEVYSGGKFTIKAVITTNDFGAAIDPSQITGDTSFDLSLGEYSFGPDTFNGTTNCVYVSGSSKAKFFLTTQVCSAADNNNGTTCPTKVYETIELSWTAKELTLSISAETGSDINGNTFETAIDADTFDGDTTGPVTDTISFEMDFGSLSVSSSITPVSGKVTTKDVTDKSGDDDTLSNVSIGGTLLPTDLGQ
jgi:hypothetical protein